MLNTKRNFFIVAILASIVFISLLFIVTQRTTDPPFTGGSGVQQAGYLILYGYETPVNQGSKAPLSMYLDSSQQTAIRSFLEVALYNTQPKKEYRGEIQPGSANVDFQNNTVVFKVNIEQPKKLYTIEFHSLTSGVSIFDEQGKKVN